jgi:hypothetical protein
MCATWLLSVSNKEQCVSFYIKVYCSPVVMLEYVKYCIHCEETASEVGMRWNIIKRVTVFLHVEYSW